MPSNAQGYTPPTGSSNRAGIFSDYFLQSGSNTFLKSEQGVNQPPQQAAISSITASGMVVNITWSGSVLEATAGLGQAWFPISTTPGTIQVLNNQQYSFFRAR